MRKTLLEAAIVVLVASLAAVAMTYPFGFQLGRVGRIDSGDGQWSIWVVNWVARTLVADPARVFDANIFYPHHSTLAYSEPNLITGALAVPAYWATKNPYFAHNLVLMISFVLSAAGAYFLARYLTRSRPAAAVTGVLFAFCPYVFAHTAHIHLMMTAGLPFSMLAFHRLADAPSARRAMALGTALALTGLCSGYYGVFAALLVSLSSLYYLAVRRRWTDWRYLAALAAAAVVAAVLLFPFLRPYVELGEGNRPARALRDQYTYSATWSSYLASAGLGHRWMLPHLPPWRDVIFPGFTTLGLAAAGVWLGLVRRRAQPASQAPGEGAPPLGESAAFYALAAAFTFWLSFGPRAGLYSLVYTAFPFFSLTRAPVRLGVVVGMALSVLAGIGLACLLRGRRRAGLLACVIGLAAMLEMTPAPLRFREIPPHPPSYDTLAQLPPGAVVEMPFFWPARAWFRHTYYMRLSTSHWKPLVNGYSDYFPPDFVKNSAILNSFPSRESFEVLRQYSVRYLSIHLNLYDPHDRALVLEGLDRFRDCLRPLSPEHDVRLYEIVSWPDP